LTSCSCPAPPPGSASRKPYSCKKAQPAGAWCCRTGLGIHFPGECPPPPAHALLTTSFLALENHPNQFRFGLGGKFLVPLPALLGGSLSVTYAQCVDGHGTNPPKLLTHVAFREREQVNALRLEPGTELVAGRLDQFLPLHGDNRTGTDHQAGVRENFIGDLFS